MAKCHWRAKTRSMELELMRKTARVQGPASQQDKDKEMEAMREEETKLTRIAFMRIPFLTSRYGDSQEQVCRLFRLS